MSDFNVYNEADKGRVPDWFLRWVEENLNRGISLSPLQDADAFYPYEAPVFGGVSASATSLFSSDSNLHTFRRALARSIAGRGTPNQPAVRVLFVTDSTGENVSQNYPQAHWVAALQRAMEARWPEALFEFPNCGVGGRQVKHVLGYNADLVTQNYLSQQVENTSGYVANASQGETARQWPWVWMGPPPGVAAWTDGQIWADRAAAFQPHLVITSFGLNEYSRIGGFQTFFVEAYELLINDMRSGARWAASRPSIVIGTPYGDSTPDDMNKRNRIAVITRGIAEKHGCALLDGNRWYNILRHGKDPLRYRVFGEVFGRYLRNSRDDGRIPAQFADQWWAPLSQPTTSGGFTFIGTTANQEGIFLRRRAARDCSISCRFGQSSAAATGVARLFARVDPTTWNASGTGVAGDPVAGYEARYSPSGLIELFYRGTLLTSVQAPAWSTLSMQLRMQMTVRNTTIEIWSAVGGPAQLPGTGAAWARRLRFQHLQAHDSAEETVSTNPGPRSVREDGYCGFGMGTTGVNTPAAIFLTSDRQALYIEWLDPLPVTSNGTGPYTDAQLQGTASEWTNATPYNPDSPGGNTVNHMTTDGYEATYAAPVAALINTLSQAVAAEKLLAWSGTKVAFTSNETASGSIARSGTTATFTWTAHGYAVGQQVRVTCSGAGDAGYNVTHNCVVTGVNTLTATVSAGLAASAPTVTLTTRNVEQILATIPVPAGWMGLDGQLEMKLSMNFSGADAKNTRVRFGTTGVGSQLVATAQVTTQEAAEYQVNLRNRNASNSVLCTALSGMLLGTGSTDPAAITLETGVLQYLYITGQATFLTGNQEISLEAFNARLVA